MKIFLDTANINEIKKVKDIGLLDGVTTNPTLISKESGNFNDICKEICDIVKGPVSAEVVSTNAKDMIDEATKLSSISKHIVVKIPFTTDGLIATNELVQMGIPVNMTLIFSLTQALLACKAKATYLSPFVGRLDDIGSDGMELALQIKEMINTYKFNSEVIVASVRNINHVVLSINAGADIITMPPNIFWQMLKHPLTDIGIERFMQDWQRFIEKSR
ncbi:MAG: fructose-6-phosphate aldolase [Deferribacterota bacterium]|nr:fructose-6-phosphate aldolase [Deferribacterota bacterium]